MGICELWNKMEIRISAIRLLLHIVLVHGYTFGSKWPDRFYALYQAFAGSGLVSSRFLYPMHDGPFQWKVVIGSFIASFPHPAWPISFSHPCCMYITPHCRIVSSLATIFIDNKIVQLVGSLHHTYISVSYPPGRKWALLQYGMWQSDRKKPWECGLYGFHIHPDGRYPQFYQEFRFTFHPVAE